MLRGPLCKFKDFIPSSTDSRPPSDIRKSFCGDQGDYINLYLITKLQCMEGERLSVLFQKLLLPSFFMFLTPSLANCESLTFFLKFPPWEFKQFQIPGSENFAPLHASSKIANNKIVNIAI